MSDYNGPERRTGAYPRLDSLAEDLREVKSTLKELTAAVNRLAVIEERQVTDRAALDRAFSSIKDHEGRLKVLETSNVANKQTNAWVHQAVWACVAVVAMVLAKKVGLM
jgi:ElaB/YqjD/DUF883 family membrane-anchored ribosome-binding protein